MILDASAIYALAKLKEFRALAGGRTLDLALYEIGNIFWKSVHLHEEARLDEAVELLNLVADAFRLLNVTTVRGREGEVLKLACERGLTFYDAAYLYLAKEAGEALVTEDEGLRRAASGLVKALSVAELLERLSLRRY